MKILKTDVLVIGAGGAGARAAIAACDAGAQVLMAYKGTIGRSGATTYSACEMAAFNVPDGAGDRSDSPECFAQDILDAGLGAAKPELVQILAERAQDAFADLENWGLSFQREGDNYLVMKGCFSTKPRGHIIKGHGEPLMRVLGKQINARKAIRLLPETTATTLLVDNGVCAGAVLINSDGSLTAVFSHAVILATGGASQVFRQNLNPPDVCGDGYRLAHEAGVKLINMEFMQAGIGFSRPMESLFNTYLWAGLPQLRNGRGKFFLKNHLPEGLTEESVILEHCKHFPFSCRDNSRYVEIGIQREIEQGGGTPNGGIMVDFSHFTPAYIRSLNTEYNIQEMFPMALEHFASRGIDLLHDPIEISCYAQAINGGIDIDCNAMSSLPGLFAAGETAGGPHGADRLGGNMFVTCQVFGKLAGESAARYASACHTWAGNITQARSQSEKTLTLMAKPIDAAAYIKALQNTAQMHMLVRRNASGMRKMLQCLEEIDRELADAPSGGQWNQENLRLMSLSVSAKLMTEAALSRTKSLGSHCREDEPEDNPN